MLNRSQRNTSKKENSQRFCFNTIVIESYENGICEWGLSFTSSNPEHKDYFPMPKKEIALRLQKYLTEHAPIS